MRLWSDSFSDGDPIPADYAMLIPPVEGLVAFGANRNPHLSWDDVPDETQSFALLFHAEARPRAVAGSPEPRPTAIGIPETRFYHWVLVDLPGGARSIAEGEYGEGVVPHGRRVANGPRNSRQGRNDYTTWFAGDAGMEGDFFGYDGPGPDVAPGMARRYVFTLLALDVAQLPLEDGFSGGDARRAMTGHVLAEADLSGTNGADTRST